MTHLYLVLLLGRARLRAHHEQKRSPGSRSHPSACFACRAAYDARRHGDGVGIRSPAVDGPTRPPCALVKTINQLRLRRAAAAPRHLLKSGATPAAGGTACRAGRPPARARKCDHTRPGMGTFLFHRADRGSRAGPEDELDRVVERRLGFLAPEDTRSSARMADTLVGAAAAAGPRFYDELRMRPGSKPPRCPRGPLERAKEKVPTTTALSHPPTWKF